MSVARTSPAGAARRGRPARLRAPADADAEAEGLTAEPRDLPADAPSIPADESEGGEGAARRGLSSLDHALRLLAAVAAHPGPIGLSELARGAGLSAAAAHRYLSSFAAAGLVRQPERSGRYDLGPRALDLGLAALSRLDVVNRAADELPALTESTGATAMLSVWGPGGPVVVRWERAATFVATTLGLGTTFPLLASATGRTFLAHLPRRVTAPLLASEAPDADPAEVEALAGAVRAAGYASVEGRLIPGLYAASAPILNWQGVIECAVTLIGTQGRIVAAEGPVVPALKAFCAAQSMPQAR